MIVKGSGRATGSVTLIAQTIQKTNTDAGLHRLPSTAQVRVGIT